MDRILRDAAGEIRIELRNENGVLTDATGAVPVEVRDGGGDVAIAATNAAHPSTGIYTLAIPSSETTILDGYEATWTAVIGGGTNIFRTRYEVIGGFFFSVAEARAFDSGALADETLYPNQTLTDGREQVESELEDACGVAFVPRGLRVVLDGSSTSSLFLPHTRVRRLVSVKVDDVASDLNDIALYGDEGRMVLQTGSFSSGYQNVSILLEHGYSQPPERIKRAALILLRDRLVGSNIHDRALSHTDESGTVSLSVAGVNGYFGIPEVDAAVEQYAERVPQIG